MKNEQLTDQEFKDWLQQQINDHWGTNKALADEIGFSAQMVGEVLAGTRGISKKFAEKLGFQRVYVYVKIPNRKQGK